MLVENEAAEEALEAIWKLTEDVEGGLIPAPKLGEQVSPEVIGELESSGLVQRRSAGWNLTPKGKREAAIVIRRSRLAERLVADVIRTPAGLMEEVACHFEHVLRKGVDEAVCTLLGHPTRCPHNRPIPAGSCCSRRERKTRSVVSRLTDLSNGTAATVAYLNPTSDGEFQKMTAMGVLPGESITLIRRFPTYVFAIGASQFAVDQGIADQVFVRVSNGG